MGEPSQDNRPDIREQSQERASPRSKDAGGVVGSICTKQVGCVPRFLEKERRPPLRHQSIRSAGNLRVFENLAQNWGESGNTFGVLGSTLWEDKLAEFKATGRSALPSALGNDIYGTYVMPCRGFGLLTDSPGGSDAGPVAIGPRGRELHTLRGCLSGCETVRSLLIEGGTLTPYHLVEAGRHFSVNGLLKAADEREHLVRWMFEPYKDSLDVTKTHNNFVATTKWAARFIQADGQRPAELIAQNFQRVVTADPSSVEPVLAPFTVGDVYASLCKKGAYAPFSAQRRSRTLIWL